ncbi:MAG: alpha/beta fold hydrolase [Saccharofermentanales bacterium]
MDYKSDSTWRKVQDYLPLENRLMEGNMPEEYLIEINSASIHIDHYKQENPKGIVVIFHGVGDNGRLLSFISAPLWKNGYEVICPDLPLYGYTEFSETISYNARVEYGIKIVEYFQRADIAMFVFGLSAGGMLAYQIACECNDITGVIATCILDQRNPMVTKRTASNPVIGTLGKRFLGILHTPFSNLKVPMKIVSNMKSIVNNEELAKLLMNDTRSAGARIPIEFIYGMLYPQIRTEAEQFDKCPFLLVHPEKDMWTDISLSQLFYINSLVKKRLEF